MRHRLTAAILLVAWSGATQACSINDITIQSMKVRFVNECSKRTDCIIMKGVATLTNACRESIGVQVKMTGFDKHKSPVATRELWPASIRNIPPGNYTFSLDQFLTHDVTMTSFSLEPIAVHRWP